jgi:small subunit ribosomal protein S20
MANHKSAEKRARQTERRTVVNAARRSRVRGSIKKVEEAIKTGDKKAAMAALKAAQPEIQRGATARVRVAKNAASRRVSRLNARIKAML